MTDFSGFAMASRPFAVRLEADPGVELVVIDNEQPTHVYELNTYHRVYRRIARSNTQLRPNDVDVTVRIHWPPNFQPVTTGMLVMYLPWEFEVIPDAWVEALNAVAAEVWVPARFVADGMARCGVRPEKLHVLGHGAPDGACAQPPKQRTQLGRPFRFLFHGGLLWRKGVDLLLEAYLNEFSIRDDVELVMHTQYGDLPVQTLVNGFMKRAHLNPMAPKVTLLDYSMSSEQLEEMFAQADVLVHSSRSEGFGLGIVEAMARGIPVILPAYGPPTEFVDHTTGFFFPANSTACTKAPCAADARSVFTPDWRTSSPLMCATSLRVSCIIAVALGTHLRVAVATCRASLTSAVTVTQVGRLLARGVGPHHARRVQRPSGGGGARCGGA
jgi:glycosyltransferase involved in cell wall biosynthesis